MKKFNPNHSLDRLDNHFPTLYASACLSWSVPSWTLMLVDSTFCSMESTMEPCSCTMVAKSLKMVFTSMMSDWKE